jgi:hypothetical protein
VSEIPLNTLHRTLRQSLKDSRFRSLVAENLSFRIRLSAPARPLHAFSHSKALWEFISVAELGLGINSKWCVCVLLLQDLLQSCARGGRRRVEDMCYERRRAEACVDESAHHALVNAGGREIV